MAVDAPENTPFLKQLVSSDKKVRDSAIDSLRTYLSSGRPFSELDLLKLWRGLFFCMCHSDRPLTQQRLTSTLASLISPLPAELFVPFVSAFWKTLVLNYTSIDSLRMDKFLLLIRRYISAAFSYLQARSWPEDLREEYLGVIRGVLLEEQGKVSDGLRYHLLDCWIEELWKVDGEGTAPVKEVMVVVREVANKGRTKVLRRHAKGVMGDERLEHWTGSQKDAGVEEGMQSEGEDDK